MTAHDDLVMATGAAVTEYNNALATIGVKDSIIAALRQQIADLEAGTPDPPPDNPPNPLPADPTLLKVKPLDLVNPTRIDMSKLNAATKLKLDTSRDYILDFPKDKPWLNQYGLHIEGGRNIQSIGGTVDVGGGFYSSGTGPGVPADHMVRRAAYILGATGQVHLEGLSFISSKAKLSEGINISAAAATVQIANCAIDTELVGEKAYNHADALQCWNGPRSLKVDGFTAVTGYQGMFLNPHDTSTASQIIEDWFLRRVYIKGTSLAKYILWVTSPPASIRTEEVYTSGGLGNWDAANDWKGVKHGVVPTTDFTAAAGAGYVTPGYAAA